MLSALPSRLIHASSSHLHSLFSPFAILGSVPYTRFGLIGVPLASFSSTFPNTSSRCSPSPSPSLTAKTRTGSLKMFSSMMPAQVFFKRVVGVEFMASAVTSPMESQQVEEIPKLSVGELQLKGVRGKIYRKPQHTRRDSEQ